MSDIQKLWEKKGFRVEFRKSNVVLIGEDNTQYFISKSFRVDDYGYEWELTELYNKEFNENIKYSGKREKA